MTGPEIVERYAHAEFAEHPEIDRALADVFNDGRLGDLELDAPRIDSHFGNDSDRACRELRIAQLIMHREWLKD